VLIGRLQLNANLDAQLKLLANQKIRLMICELVGAMGRQMSLTRLREKTKIPAATLAEYVREMKSAQLVTATGNTRVGITVRLKEFSFPSLTPRSLFEMERGRKLQTYE
jgi:DNA-binding IclR family transcriptional regulator